MLDDGDFEGWVDRNGLHALSREQCLHLIAQSPMGRVGVTWDVLPVILPVNHVLDGERIVIRTAAGTKLCAALSHAVVAYEVDGFDSLGHTGWSVLVRGPAREIVAEDDLERVRRLPLRPWANDAADRFISIGIELVSGRRVDRDQVAWPGSVPAAARTIGDDIG